MSIKGINKTYPRAACPAVDNVDLDIEAGGFVTIIGKSGSGKSTLINIAVGLLRPDAGSVALKGADLFSLNDYDMSKTRNRHIGYVPQSCGLLSNLSVEDNIRLPAFFFGNPSDSVKRANRLLEQVGLAGFGKRKPNTLSGGECRRVAIARAMMQKPELLVADEPTGDLDHETTRDIMDLLSGLNKAGTAILLVTHDLDSTQYGEELMVMEKGRLWKQA